MKRWTLKKGRGTILLLCVLLALTGCQKGTEAAKPLSSAPAPEAEAATGVPAAASTAAPDAPTDAPAPSGACTPEPTFTPEPTSTPEPSFTPEPTSTPEPTPLVITAAQLDGGEFDGFFDDALFVGDSVTKCLSGYVRKMRAKDPSFLGRAQFLGTTSMTVWQASRNENVFEFRGQLISVTKGIQLTEAKKIFILLGVNDIWFRDWDEVAGYFADLFRLIRRECPGAEIIVQGVLPVSETYCRNHSLKIGYWNSFNEILQRVCEENEVDYFSFAHLLMDERGYLNPALAEGDIHPNDAGDAVWVRALRTYGAQRLHPDAVMESPAEETEEKDR